MNDWFHSKGIDGNLITSSDCLKKNKRLGKKYKDVHKQCRDSGMGNLTNDEVEGGSWAETCRKKFNYYSRVHNFLSSKHNHNPSVVVASGILTNDGHHIREFHHSDVTIRPEHSPLMSPGPPDLSTSLSADNPVQSF